jgi:hypothetical protein
MLTGLRHHTLVGSNDEQTSINPANPSKHVTYESFVAGNVHEAHSAPAWEREPGEAKLNRKPSGFLLSQSIRIDSSKRMDKCRLAVIDVTCGSYSGWEPYAGVRLGHHELSGKVDM